MCEEQVNIPEGWEVRQLDELAANITSGGTPAAGSSRYYTSEGGLPFAKTEDLTRAASKNIEACELQITEAALKESAAKPYPVGTILVSMYGTIGLTKITASVMAANQALCALLAPFRCNVDYLYHQLDFIRPKWSRFSGQTTQANISGSIVRKAQLLVPPRNEQLVIAHILDTLDTHIHKTEALIAKLEKVKEGLLHDLLTRGIDENGQLRPSPEQAPELYKESPLGLIPREWNPKKIGHLSSSIVDGPFGSNLKTEHYVTEPGVRVVRLQNITPFEYDDTDRAFIKDGHAETLSKNIVQPEDVLIASLGDGNHPAGRACLYPPNLPEAINKADCFRLRADSRVVTNSYIMLFMNSELFAKQARKWTQGVTLQRINTTSLKRICISCPPLEEQEIISRKFNKALFLLATKREELDKLVLKKHGLMDDLLTGRVRVTPLLDQAQASTPA